MYSQITMQSLEVNKITNKSIILIQLIFRMQTHPAVTLRCDLLVQQKRQPWRFLNQLTIAANGLLSCLVKQVATDCLPLLEARSLLSNYFKRNIPRNCFLQNFPEIYKKTSREIIFSRFLKNGCEIENVFENSFRESLDVMEIKNKHLTTLQCLPVQSIISSCR